MDSQLPDDGLKWFGEGFDGFPKRLPDDCVEYVVCVIDEKFNTQNATRTRLNDIVKASNELKKTHLKNYIWQREEFSLVLDDGFAGHKSPERDHSQAKPVPHLRGRTNFGDSVADEWLIVWLLLELTKKFKDAWVRVYDTDGEFLLIESANALPKWLNPEIAENRVWLNDGHIKIIPIDDKKSNENCNISFSEALTILRDKSSGLHSSSAIEDEAFHRLRDYPATIAQSMHRSRTSLPRRLAWILHNNPPLISPAVEAFYLRDPISLRPLTTKDTSTLNFPPEDFVTTSIRYTKVGFAQLRGQLFNPPPAWVGVGPRVGRDESAAIGMKVACGMEMLICDAMRKDDRAVRELKILLEDIDSGEEKLPTDAEVATWDHEEDDEKWLDVDYADFEKELEGRKGREDGEDATGFGDKAAQENLRKMVSRFEKFMEDDDAGAEGIDDSDNDESDEDDHDASDASDDDDGDDTKATSDGAESSARKQTEPEPDQGKLNPPSETETHVDDDANKSKKAPSWKSHVASVEFEKAISDIHGMSGTEIESSGLLAEARKLALEDDSPGDGKDDLSAGEEEEEDLREVMRLMKKELRIRKARKANKHSLAGQDESEESTASRKPFFGPERPPHMLANDKGKQAVVRFNDDDSDGDESLPPLSSDDEDYADGTTDYNNVDLDLAKNLLEAFKGQAGTSGPAGNLMRALGVNGMLPQDADDAIDARKDDKD